MSEHGRVEFLNPAELPRNPAFSNVVAVSGPVRTIWVGGQNAVTPSGEVVGKGDIGAQTEQILRNLRAALGAGGARLEHVIKWNIYVVDGHPLEPAIAAFQRVWGDRPNPPLITVARVAGLALPDCLAELEAVAVVPQ